MDIQYLISVWLLFVIGLSFVSLKWAVVGFIIHSLLVPIMEIRIGGFILGESYVRLFFILGFLFYVTRKKYKFDWQPFIPFVIYFILSLLIIPFQDGMPYGEMLDRWRRDVMSCLIIPFVMWYIIKVDTSVVILFKYTMLVVIMISIGYGLLLTQFDGLNPYMMVILSAMNTDYDYESYYEVKGGRMFGRISSVFLHPMSFALFIGLSLIYLYYIRKNTNKIIVITLLAATGVMGILCGVRSVLGGLIVALAYFFFVGRNYKVMFATFFITVLVLAILSFIPGLDDYVGSIFDVNNKKGDVSGSSIEMRLSQLEGAIQIASSSPAFGMGYGWTAYYMNLYEYHPVCLCFESLVYVILCNSGIFGFLIWIIMVIKYFKNNKRMHVKGSILTNALMIFYITYSTITGEYGYMKTFIIFYILMLGESMVASPNNVNPIKRKQKIVILQTNAIPSNCLAVGVPCQSREIHQSQKKSF